MSKGSSYRPTDKAAFDSGYERIFGKNVELKTYGQSMGTNDGENWHPVEMPPEIQRQMNSRIRAVTEAIIRGNVMTQEMKDGSVRTVDPYPGTGNPQPLKTIGIAQGRRFVVHGENGPSAAGELYPDTGALIPLNQNCGNCKHWRPMVEGCDTICMHPDVLRMCAEGSGGLKTTADFGCNRWKAKE